MPLAHAKDLFRWASDESRSLAAFNAITLEHAEAIAAAAEETGLPVIIQLSENAVLYHGSVEPTAAGLVSLASRSSATIALHLDHITDEELAKKTAAIGFSSIMFDASHDSYEDNVRRTSEFVAFARSHDLWVESELGEIGGKDGAHAPGVQTPPQDAKRYSDETDVDSLAVAVGSSHAMVEKTASLNIELISEIASLIDVPLVLHGSSGVPDDQIVAACEAGMTKINIGTALNIAFTGAVRETLATTESTDPRKYFAKGRDAMAEVVAHYLRVISGPRS
jgi:fructose-bisphosphate aldolase class II